MLKHLGSERDGVLSEGVIQSITSRASACTRSRPRRPTRCPIPRGARSGLSFSSEASVWMAHR
jgi:hypothetical protein